MKGCGALSLDPHHLDIAPEPGGDPGDQATAADGHQDRVGVGDLGVQFQPERPGSGDHLGLVVGVGEQPAMLRGIRLARRQGVRIHAGDEMDHRAVGRRGSIFSVGDVSGTKRCASLRGRSRMGDGPGEVATGGGHHSREACLPTAGD